MRPEASSERKRRSPRVFWQVPVVMIWTGPGGLRVRERAETEIVNAHGALLRLRSPLQSGKQVELLDPRTNVTTPARVIWSAREGDTSTRAGVELAEPNETFWGLYIPVEPVLSPKP